MSWFRYLPSLTTLLSVFCVLYVANAVYSLCQLYVPPKCRSEAHCIHSSLQPNSAFRYILLTSKGNPRSKQDLQYAYHFDVDNVQSDSVHHFTIPIPPKIRQKERSLVLAIFCLPLTDKQSFAAVPKKWEMMVQHPQVSLSLFTLTQLHVPEPDTYSLLGDSSTPSAAESLTPVSHVRRKLNLFMLADAVDMPLTDIPPELVPLLKTHTATESKTEYLPIVYVSELHVRINDLVKINSTSKQFTLELHHSPITFGKLRLFLQLSNALKSMSDYGFSLKDTDEVKGIIVDTNFTLLLVTLVVAAFHTLFDFLAFKNDIYFWKGKRSMEGLSSRTVLWRSFSQAVIFLYLLDEDTSLLILVPAGIATIIEAWKVTKALKLTISFRNGLQIRSDSANRTSEEKATEALDSTAMTYLSYLLYPLCALGALYSLLYTPHRSWYSWTLQSLVNGVYAFGFLFMLPQLFVNYKLKSVAHLPWKSFMYKAFNTFIDDLFAFIITMPTAHRVACFRDDVVFLIYLYQRWLYPVDKGRLDTSQLMEDASDQCRAQQKKSD